MGAVRVYLLMLLSPLVASAQIIIDPAQIPRQLRSFQPVPGEKPLRCEAEPFKPRVDFGLRFQASYVLRVPLNQYSGSGHGWAIVARVTPEGGSPVHLLSGIALPEIPGGTKIEAEVGGTFLLGEGRYFVELAVADTSGRVCRRSWRLEAARSRSERKVIIRQPPATVESLSTRHTVSTQPGDRPYRITVLANAAPLSRRATRMRAFDREMLFGTLAPLLELLPASSVRLVVFSLEQQKRLFTKDGFRPEDMDEVARILAALELGTVDYDVLQNRGGHLNLLADLINAEINTRPPSDAVVFLGPTSRYIDRFPASALVERSASGPRFFSLRYRPYFGRVTPDFPDLITDAVKKLKGRSVTVHTPAEFSKAIKELESRLGQAPAQR